MIIEFVIPGTPVGKGRPRIAKRGSHHMLYTPLATANYESLVATSAHNAMSGAPLFDEPVFVRMTIVCAVPPSWSLKKRQEALNAIRLPTSRPDLDNIVKAVFDGCNGVLWRDDVLVVSLMAAKRYGPAPFVQVYVAPVTTVAVP